MFRFDRQSICVQAALLFSRNARTQAVHARVSQACALALRTNVLRVCVRTELQRRYRVGCDATAQLTDQLWCLCYMRCQWAFRANGSIWL